MTRDFHLVITDNAKPIGSVDWARIALIPFAAGPLIGTLDTAKLVPESLQFRHAHEHSHGEAVDRINEDHTGMHLVPDGRTHQLDGLRPNGNRLSFVAHFFKSCFAGWWA